MYAEPATQDATQATQRLGGGTQGTQGTQRATTHTQDKGGDIELEDDVSDEDDGGNVRVGGGAGRGGTQAPDGALGATASQAQRARNVRALLDSDSD